MPLSNVPLSSGLITDSLLIKVQALYFNQYTRLIVSTYLTKSPSQEHLFNWMYFSVEAE